MSSLSDLKVRLDSRKKVLPAVFSENMKLREETHHLGMSLLLMSESQGAILIGYLQRQSHACQEVKLLQTP